MDKRASWSSKTEFLLTCIGYAVGLGNIWRFPYLCYKNGGGAFLVPYLIAVGIIGFPLVCLEFAIGQYTGMGLITIWEISPIFKGIGITFLMMNILICVYFLSVMATSMLYMVESFSTELPWLGCHHEWNSEHCFDVINNQNNESVCNSSTVFSSSNKTVITPEEEYMVNEVYHLTSGITEIGNINWKLWACLLSCWILIYIMTIQGVRSFGKVVYFTSTVPYILLTILLIRGLLLPGSMDGIAYYLIPKWSRLLDAKVWFSAAQQVFYSQGMALGCFITMSSFNKYDNNFIRQAVISTAVNSFTSLYAGLAVFSILGFMARESCQSIEDVVNSGPGFAFIAYPRALATLPFSQVWAVSFFCMLVIIGISSQAVHFEAVITCMTDQFPICRTRFYRAGLSFVCVLISIAIGTILTTQGGMYIFTLVDWFAVPFGMMIIAMLECIVLGWVYGSGKLSKNITDMVALNPYVVWLLTACWRFITPAFVLVILVINIITWENVTYRGYTYPNSAISFGWCLTLAVLLPIPVVATYKTIQHLMLQRSCSSNKTWKDLLRPSEKFVSHVSSRRKEYENENNNIDKSETCTEMKLIQSI